MAKIELTLLILWNIITFCIMGLDKLKSIRNQWRIRERTLFISALCFGSLGIYIGMVAFRHKTKHLSFQIGIPCLLILQFVLIKYFL